MLLRHALGAVVFVLAISTVLSDTTAHGAADSAEADNAPMTAEIREHVSLLQTQSRIAAAAFSAAKMEAVARRRASGIPLTAAKYNPQDDGYPGAQWHTQARSYVPGLMGGIKPTTVYNNLAFQEHHPAKYQITMRKQNAGLPYPYWNVPYKYFAPQPTPSAPHLPPPPPLPPQPRPLMSRVSRPDTRCVVCQFLTQRIRAEVLINGLGGGMPFGNYKPTPTKPYNGFGPRKTPKPFNSNPGNMFGSQSFGPGFGSSAAPAMPTFVETDSASSKRGIGSFIKKGFNAVKKGVVGMAKSFIANMNAKPIYTPPYMPRPSLYVKPMPNPARAEFLWKNKRERNADMVVYKPTQSRYSNMYEGPLRNERRAQERYENNQMYADTFNDIDDI